MPDSARYVLGNAHVGSSRLGLGPGGPGSGYATACHLDNHYLKN